jgi:hypothetical protein
LAFESVVIREVAFLLVRELCFHLSPEPFVALKPLPLLLVGVLHLSEPVKEAPNPVPGDGAFGTLAVPASFLSIFHSNHLTRAA